MLEIEFFSNLKKVEIEEKVKLSNENIRAHKFGAVERIYRLIPQISVASVPLWTIIYPSFKAQIAIHSRWVVMSFIFFGLATIFMCISDFYVARKARKFEEFNFKLLMHVRNFDSKTKVEKEFLEQFEIDFVNKINKFGDRSWDFGYAGILFFVFAVAVTFYGILYYILGT